MGFTAIFAVNIVFIKLFGVGLDKNTGSDDSISIGTNKRSLKELLPYGLVATKKWLMAQGLSAHAIDNAVKSKTLFLLTYGVYSQYSQSINWEGVVSSLQRMLDDVNTAPSIQVGGLTALTLSGLSQYLSLGRMQSIHLYAYDKLPSWLARLPLDIKFEWHSTKKLWMRELSQNLKFVRKHEWSQDLPPVYFSCPEKAIIEVLQNVPNSISFEHADELMQGLVNLSPRKLDELLKGCKNIKVKRLFFWLAKRQDYPWFKKLDESLYDLGVGKRVVARAGKLNKDYLITVPSHMEPKEN